RLRAVLDERRTVEQSGNPRMPLEALKRVVGIEQRIGGAETGDKPDGNLVARQSVDERPAKLAGRQWITQGVNHSSWRNACPGRLPQLLDTERVDLRLPVGTEVEPGDQLLREVAPHAVTKHGDAGPYVDAGLEGAGRLSLAIEAAVGRPDAGDCAVLGNQLATGKPAEDVDTCG